MLRDSVIKTQKSGSMLKAYSLLCPENQQPKKDLAIDISVTSLVDIFSILVIYLLVLTLSTSEKTLTSQKFALPAANQVTQLSDVSVVKFEGGQFFVDDKPVAEGQLAKELIELRKNLSEEKSKDPTIILQADKEASYAKINSVVLAAAIGGFSRFQMAVLPEGSK